MPELPEVEITREHLERWLIGRRIREDICNVPGPGLPVFPVPASLDDLGEYRAGWQVERRKGQFGGALSVEPITAEDDPIGRRVIEVDLVDLGIEPVIVRAQRPQGGPGIDGLPNYFRAMQTSGRKFALLIKASVVAKASAGGGSVD